MQSMAGLLTYSPLLTGLPIRRLTNSGMKIIKELKELTAAGTVQDFHPIPYYHARCVTTNSGQR